jgi:hypothetical protein
MCGLQEKEQALTGISEAAKGHTVKSRAKRSLIYDNLLKEYRWIPSLPSPDTRVIEVFDCLVCKITIPIVCALPKQNQSCTEVSHFRHLMHCHAKHDRICFLSISQCLSSMHSCDALFECGCSLVSCSDKITSALTQLAGEGRSKEVFLAAVREAVVGMTKLCGFNAPPSAYITLQQARQTMTHFMIIRT